MAAKEEPQVCIVTVTGKDRIGIIAKLAVTMAKANINILDLNQKVMENNFVMTMAVDVSKATVDMASLKKRLDKVGREMKLVITIQDQNIFKAMHRV